MKKVALSWYKNNNNYKKVLEKYGLPYIILSPEEKISWQEIGAIIFIGGEDIHPSYYNEKEEDNLNIDKNRDEWEFYLIENAFKKRKPILGICRGCQLINIFLGGSLYQDLKKFKKEGKMSYIHWQENGEDSFHNVKIKKNTLLYKILKKEEILVNSSHYQAIKNLGKNLYVSAIFLDDIFEIIEGIEYEDYPYLIGIQWHPERLNSDISYKIFISLKEFI